MTLVYDGIRKMEKTKKSQKNLKFWLGGFGNFKNKKEYNEKEQVWQDIAKFYLSLLNSDKHLSRNV